MTIIQIKITDLATLCILGNSLHAGTQVTEEHLLRYAKDARADVAGCATLTAWTEEGGSSLNLLLTPNGIQLFDMPLRIQRPSKYTGSHTLSGDWNMIVNAGSYREFLKQQQTALAPGALGAGAADHLVS